MVGNNREFVEMSLMEVEISGLDEALQGLEDLKDAISAETMVLWTRKIQGTATARCGEGIDFSGSITSEGKFNLKTAAKPDNIGCLVEAIQAHLSSMHPATRSFFERVIYGLIAEKAKAPTPVDA